MPDPTKVHRNTPPLKRDSSRWARTPTRIGAGLPAAFRSMNDPRADVIAAALEEGRDAGKALAEYLRQRDRERAA